MEHRKPGESWATTSDNGVVCLNLSQRFLEKIQNFRGHSGANIVDFSPGINFLFMRCDS